MKCITRIFTAHGMSARSRTRLSRRPSARATSGGQSKAGLLAVVALLFMAPDRIHAEEPAHHDAPSLNNAQLAPPPSDPDRARQEAADERIAAFLIAEAREELELGELRSARRRLEILVTRYASTSVSPRARRLLEQLAMIDGYPMPPAPKGKTAAMRPPVAAGEASPLATRAPGMSLLEADFSANGGDRLFFAEGSADVGGRGLRILREKALWLKRHAKVFLRIEGHADDSGGDEINSAMALRRAESVRDVLVEAGVPATRMHIAAFGREHPVSQCAAPACAAQNRRAVLILTDARGARLSAVAQRTAGHAHPGGSAPQDFEPARPHVRRDR